MRLYSKIGSLSLASLLLAAISLSGCGGKQAEPEKEAANAGAASSGSSQSIDYYKFDPAIHVTAGRLITQETKYPAGQSADDNVWEQLYKQNGINIDYTWTVKGTNDQYAQKLNVAIASGDIPDIIKVNSTQLKQLVDADMLEDLSGVVDKYASPAVQEIYSADKTTMQAATYDGKLYAIPLTEPMITMQTPLLWLRTDWLKKVNLEEPKTWDDVLKISEAFTKQDPDGDGQNDTFGLALSKDIINGYPSLNGFFNAYGAYPKLFVKDGSGKLVYGSIQPEVKTALAKLAEMYKSGEFDKEFGVKDGGKAVESVVSNKIGMIMGPSWASNWPILDNKNNNPDAEWKSYAIPSVNGGEATVQMPFGASSFYVVKKGYEHPEVIVKLANLTIEKTLGKTAEYTKYAKGDDGVRIRWPGGSGSRSETDPSCSRSPQNE